MVAVFKKYLKGKIMSNIKEQNFSISVGAEGEILKPNIFNLVELDIEGTKVRVDLQKELEFNELNLMEPMQKQAGQYAWWASMGCTVSKKIRDKKGELSVKLDALDLEARSALKEDGFRVTEAAVKSWVSNDTRIKSLFRRIADLESVLDFIQAVLRSLEHRRDMLKEVNKINMAEYNQQKELK